MERANTEGTQLQKKALRILWLLFIISCISITAIGCNSEVKGRSFTSTAVNGHTHTVVIHDADYANPPNEKIYTLSKGADGHTHKIVLRKIDFTNMNNGHNVTRYTSQAEDGHDHQVTVK